MYATYSLAFQEEAQVGVKSHLHFVEVGDSRNSAVVADPIMVVLKNLVKTREVRLVGED